MTWAGAAVPRLIAAAVVLIGGGVDAAAADEPGGCRSVFVPPLPAVRQPDEEPPLFDLGVTGRAGDVYPRIDGLVSLEVQNDYVAKSDEKDNEINDLTTSNDLFLAVRATRELSLQTSLVVEDVKSPRPGNNRYFQDVGVFVETLGLVYQSGAATLFGGKFNPSFGVAWDLGFMVPTSPTTTS